MRPSAASPVDLTVPHELTVGLIDRLRCPEGKSQAFLRDRKAPALRVRVTASGAKSYVFEAKLGRQTIRRTIGDVRSWTIDAARIEANRQRVLIDGGADPRELERQEEADRHAKAAEKVANAVTVAEAWAEYLQERQPRWGEHHYRDHVRHAKAGGVPAARGTRGKGQTIAGPLHALMALRLADLTADRLREWVQVESTTRPTATRLCWRLLRGFLNWCAEHRTYARVLPSQNPAKARVVRELVGKPKAKQDALLREQLPAWFGAVRQLPNPLHAAYLQTLVLTGARPNEVLSLRWADLNLKWKGLTIRDKVEGERTIPLTPYVQELLDGLPRVNEWVFASPVRDPSRVDAHMSEPHHAHDRACAVAGIEDLTLHGLRRSFKSLTEWLEIPAGVVAQLMGHKPSATAEKHYTVRPLDLLRIHHERIEQWILEQAAIAPPVAGQPRLRAVKSA